MIQAGRKTIDLIEWETREPEKQALVTHFLRTLTHGYKSVVIIGGHYMYPLCALHFNVPQITWYSQDDNLDNYLNQENHKRIERRLDTLIVPESDLVIFSMSDAIQTNFPERWVARLLVKTRKRAIVLNSLIGFDAEGQAHKTKDLVNTIFENNTKRFALDNHVEHSFGVSQFLDRKKK